MKKITKIIIITILIIIVLTILMMILLIYKFFFSATVINNINEYDERKDSFTHAENVMPDLKLLPKYENIHYQYRKINYFPFYAETMLLIVTYDEETYKNELEKIDRMAFLQNPINNNKGDYLIPKHEFVINNYSFKVLNGDNYYYPKTIGLIATSDKNNNIAYLYFEDADIDIITNMENFIEFSFKYKW